ncbi:MAG: hypothetical protein PHO29_01835 [Acetobacterium sp.]|nr:hypothetical protein [Acetobacterium sp.]
MGLDLILEATEKKKFYENSAYFNQETEDEIPFNVRCQTRTIESLKNEEELMGALGDIEVRAFREIESCRYIIVDKESVQELIRNPNLSEEAQQALEKVLEEVDFEKEIFTVYPWW